MKLHKEVTHRILKFYLLKFKFNQKKNIVKEEAVFSFLANVKKTLLLILQYQRAGKLIVFVGLTPVPELFVLKYTHHKTLSLDMDLKSFVSSGFYFNAHESIEVTPRDSSRIKPDLVVVLSHGQKEILLKECVRLKLPFISYNSFSGFFEINSIINNSLFSAKVNSNNLFFFESCLMFLIKKVFKHPRSLSLGRKSDGLNDPVKFKKKL